VEFTLLEGSSKGHEQLNSLELGVNGVGREKRLVKGLSVPLGKPSSKDLDGMSPMRFSLPGQWVQSARPLLVMSCHMPRQCSISSVKGGDG
jgi:hypothetical protein